MRLAFKEAMFAPSVLANAMHHVSTGANMSPLAVVNTGNPHKVTEPETSDIEDVDRTPVASSDEEVVSLPTASDYQRHDAWMKLNCPPRNVPCLRIGSFAAMPHVLTEVRLRMLCSMCPT